MSLQGKLQAFCSHNEHFSTFLTTNEGAATDVDTLLQVHGAPSDVRARINGLLTSSPDYSSGFRFEEGGGDEGDKTVVYVSLPNKYIDANKPDAADELSRIQEEKESAERPNNTYTIVEGGIVTNSGNMDYLMRENSRDEDAEAQREPSWQQESA